MVWKYRQNDLIIEPRWAKLEPRVEPTLSPNDDDADAHNDDDHDDDDDDNDNGDYHDDDDDNTIATAQQPMANCQADPLREE